MKPLSKKRIIWTYILCLLIIPVVFGILWGGFSGVTIGKKLSKIEMTDDEFKIFMAERDIDYEILENLSGVNSINQLLMIKDLPVEERKKIENATAELLDYDLKGMQTISMVLFSIMNILTGLLAAYLLLSMKHIYIMTGIVFLNALQGLLFGVPTNWILVIIYTMLFILSGFWGIKIFENRQQQAA